MIIKFYGTRGSLPVCGSEYVTFGGKTSCITIMDDDGRFYIIDAGTGVRDLGKELIQDEEAKEYTILFTHLHWDHIQGMPFFLPAYKNKNTIHLQHMNPEMQNELKKAMEQQMSSAYFPISIYEMGADIQFTPFEEGQFETIDLSHPGGCKGFKFSSIQDHTVAYLVDHELNEENFETYVNFCANVDVLIHDAQYTTREYEKCVNWGHTSYENAIRLAQAANVKRLIMTHHDPDHNDEFLDDIERQCKQILAKSELARDGLEIELHH